MQASKIYVNNQQVFELSALSSEWLFSIKFWNFINNKCGTVFDQYEEDVVDEMVGAVIIEKLNSLCLFLANSRDDNVIFSRGWSTGNELQESINKEYLLNSICDFKKSLIAAMDSGGDVSLSL